MHRSTVRVSVAACLALASMSFSGGRATAQTAFVNFELPPQHAVELTPDGNTLLVVNTADDRLEVFDLSSGWPMWTAAIPVGLSPVSVRARTDTEVWVANQLSDSVSIVSLTTRNVVKTLFPGDEPTDVIFAGAPQRAFVALPPRSWVAVYDPSDLTLAPQLVTIAGKSPSTLATNGTKVFAAIRESGNRTTVVSRDAVNAPDGPYAGQNPPPNDGAAFNPPIEESLPPPPQVAQIVRRVGGQWMDDNGGDWSSKVTWDMVDHDVAIIDASTLGVSYASSLMNLVFGLAVRPYDGKVIVIGTDAINDVRFEPNLTAQFVRVTGAIFPPANPAAATVFDLNPHLTYATPSIPQAERDKALGDPRGIAIKPPGNRVLITGMGSNNLIVLDETLTRMGDPTPLGQGPTSITLDNPRNRAYILNRFDGTISVVETTFFQEIGRVPFFDPTSAAVKNGRHMLYNTHTNSGLGQVSCGSCHVDAHIDQLVWDLGNPAGAMIVAPESDCAEHQPPPPFTDLPCPDFHPMKGPMRTQTLAGIINNGPMHYRGDRANLHAFDIAFPGLLGADDLPSPESMQAFADFLATIRFQPNPFRTINDLLPSSIPILPGNPITGQNIMFINGRVGNTISCVTCHEIQGGGTDRQTVPGAFLGEPQTFKTPHLRNMYRKLGFDKGSQTNLLGNAFTHDGSVGTLFEFLQNPIFTFPAGATGDTERNHVAAFMAAFSTGTHAATGQQLTVDGFNNNDTAVVNRLNSFITVANTNNVGLVARGIVGGQRRGYVYVGGNNFQPDRAADPTVTATTLRTGAIPGEEITFTIVPFTARNRIGVDRDADGYFDGDELAGCSDPNNPLSIPGMGLPGDATGDNLVGLDDVAVVISNWYLTGAPGTAGDLDGDGVRGVSDIALVLLHWGESCP